MAFFSGEYESKLDAKGRLVLPARIKSNLPETNKGNIVITRGFEPCLVIYSLLEWNKVLSKIAGLSEFNDEQRNLQRNLISRSSEAELDNLGRFVIPKKMIEYAKLEGAEITILGIGNKIEVWNSSQYDQIQIKDSAELSKLAEKYLGGV
jgi:MraZ protein